MTKPHGIRGIALAWALLGSALGSAAAGEDAPKADAKPRLADYFGFLPLELYKLDYRIGNLTIADVDGDGAGDVIVANNARSRIDLLLSSPKPAAEADARPFRKEVNELESDKRMRSATVPVDREVVSLGVGDFNGDGKPDLVFYGTPAEVVILPNEGGGKFGAPRRIKSGEALESANALAVGDVDRDGRDDVVLLTEGEVVLIRQPEPGVLTEPERSPHAATTPSMIKLQDLDGDGGLDVVILDGDSEHPIRARLSTPDKKLGPEEQFAIPKVRALAFGQIDGKPGAEVLTVEEQSGRGKVFALGESAPDSDAKWGRLAFFGLPKGNERGRGLAVGDLDGDGKKDVVVTDPAVAQFRVYRQTDVGGLGAAETFPGLLGGGQVVLADLDGDGEAEAFVLSEQEKQIGRSRFEGGRLTFPAALPIKGEPVAMALADVGEPAGPAIVHAVRTKPGAETFELRAIRPEGADGFADVKFAAAESVPISGLTGAPSAIRALDVDRDGRTDLLVFSAFGSPILLLGQEDGGFKPLEGGLGPLGGATPAGVNVVDLDGPAVFVAQNTFARDVLLEDGRWRIKDQFNAARSAAQIQGAASLDIDGEGRKDVVLLDRASKSLLFLTSKDGVFRQVGELAVGPINFEGLHIGDFDGDGRDDLLIAGADRFAVLQTGGRGRRLKEIASYEPRIAQSRLGDVIAGDFNADGAADAIFTDVAEQALDVATYDGAEDLLFALTFKLYERKSYRGGGGNAFEPREMAAGDVDGDGRTDLVMVLHDRVVVLRQDPGPEQKPAETAAK